MSNLSGRSGTTPTTKHSSASDDDLTNVLDDDRSAFRAALEMAPVMDGQAAYAVDVSVMVRCDAKTSPERALVPSDPNLS